MNNSIIENPNLKPEPQVYPVVYASLFKRWAASVINTVLFYLSLAVLSWLFSILGVQTLREEALFLVGFAAVLFYFVIQCFFMYKYGQTIGKKLLKIRVIDYISQRPISFGRYFLRELIDFIFGFVLGLPILISGIMALASKEKRSLTDLIMKTIVVKTN